jgi:ankyrin repeat protein
MMWPLKKKNPPQGSMGGSEAERGEALLTAAYSGDVVAVIAALEDGADVSVRHAPTGLTALHIAAGTNNLALAKLLIEDWQAPFVPDNMGRMPSIVAAECGADEELGSYMAAMEAMAEGPE